MIFISDLTDFIRHYSPRALLPEVYTCIGKGSIESIDIGQGSVSNSWQLRLVIRSIGISHCASRLLPPPLHPPP